MSKLILLMTIFSSFAHATIINTEIFETPVLTADCSKQADQLARKKLIYSQDANSSQQSGIETLKNEFLYEMESFPPQDVYTVVLEKNNNEVFEYNVTMWGHNCELIHILQVEQEK